MPGDILLTEAGEIDKKSEAESLDSTWFDFNLEDITYEIDVNQDVGWDYLEDLRKMIYWENFIETECRRKENGNDG